MTSLWRFIVPELKALPCADQRAVVDSAKRSAFSIAEVIVLVAWTLVVFAFTQQVIRQSTHENKLAFALVANLVITLPLMVFVFVPVYLRKMRRHILAGLIERRRAG